MDLLDLFVGFLGGSVVATLLQVRSEWRRRRGERVVAGAETLLNAVDDAIAAVDRFAEAGGVVYETDRRVRQLFNDIALGSSGSSFAKSPSPKELDEYNNLMSELQEAFRAQGSERTAAAQATVERVLPAIPDALKALEDETERRHGVELARAVAQSIVAQVNVIEVNLEAHQAIDASRRKRSRLAIALAEVPTRTSVLAGADAVIAALHGFRMALDNAISAQTDPRMQAAVASARARCGTEVDAFCLQVADAVEGTTSRWWRWRF